MTYPVIESSRRVAFLVAGEEKAEIFSAIRAGASQVPAAHVRPVGELFWFVDRAAAGEEQAPTGLRCDIILVMTVNPGFGGQTFLFEMLPKIRRMRAVCADRGLHPVIEVDGGENATTAAQAASAGATAIVAGSAIFGAKDYAKAIADIRAEAAAAAMTS
jgi:hypothetical protein